MSVAAPGRSGSYQVGIAYENGLAVLRWMAGGGHYVGRRVVWGDVYTRCLYTICRGCLCNINLWYPVIDSSWGTRPPHGQAGPSIASKNWHIGGTPCSEYVFAMDMLVESKLAFRQDQDGPAAMVSVKQMVVTKTCQKKAKSTPLESFGSLRLQSNVTSSVLSRFRPSPASNGPQHWSISQAQYLAH